MAYLRELFRWNAAYNLTAVRDPAEMVIRHLLDSLAVLPDIDSRFPADSRRYDPHSVGPLHAARGGIPDSPRVVDAGAGAGLPGIPLAIARPDWRVTLLDSNGKKVRFMRHALRVLGLDNAEAVQSRSEAFQPQAAFDIVISRAFAALGDFLRLTGHLAGADGVWLAMKGKLEHSELENLPEGFEVSETTALSVPGLPEARHLVVVRRQAAP